MKIEPKYIRFKQAKFFKEKGFTIDLKEAWIEGFNHIIKSNYSTFDDLEVKGFAPRILRKEAYRGDSNYEIHAPAYEQWQVAEWLRVKHGEFISIQPYLSKYKFLSYKVDDIFSARTPITNNKLFDTVDEAYSAAFDYILSTNLLK